MPSFSKLKTDLEFVALELEGVPDVHGEVGGDEERDQLPPRSRPLVLRRVAAPPEAVDDHRGLQEDLDDLVRNNESK